VLPLRDNAAYVQNPIQGRNRRGVSASVEALKNPDQKTAAYSERVFMPGPELIFVARFEIPAKSVLF